MGKRRKYSRETLLIIIFVPGGWEGKRGRERKNGRAMELYVLAADLLLDVVLLGELLHVRLDDSAPKAEAARGPKLVSERLCDRHSDVDDEMDQEKGGQSLP
jgi:hypothetical protein